MEDLRAQIQEAVSQDGTGWLEELLLSYRTAAGAAEPEGPGTQPRRASEASPVGGEQLRGRPQRRKQPPARLSPSPANKRRGMRSSRGEDEAAAAAKTGSKMAPGSKRLAGKRPATRQRSPPASGSRRIEAQPSSTASAAAAPSATGQRALAQKTAQTRSGAGMSQTEERGNTREGRVPRQHRRASQPERRAEGRQQKGRGTSRRGNITGTAATYSTPASTPASSPISSPASTPASSPTPDILSPGRAQRGRGSRFQGSRSPTQSPLAAGQASRSHGMPSYYGANRPESSLYPGQQRGSYTTQRPSRHTSVVQPPATSMQHRCFVNPRYLDPRLQETLGYASQVSANYASSSRQGQGARRRRRDRARAIRLESRRSGQLEQAGSASSSSSGRARADSRVDRSSSGEDRRDSDEHRHLLNVQVEPSSRDYRSYRSQGHSHGRSCGHQPGLAYQQRAQEATQKDSRQPTPDRRIRRRDTAGTSPLALPEVGRADGSVQGPSSTGGGRGGTMPPSLMEAGRAELLKLVETSVTRATWNSYNSIWLHWLSLSGGSVADGDKARAATLDMLAALRKKRRSVGAAKKHLAGVAFLLKLHGKADVTKDFMFRQVIRGWKKEKTRVDKRRPITFSLLVRLLELLESVCDNSSEALLFRAAFSVAFFAALRIGELVPASKNKPGGLRHNDVIPSGESLRVCIRKSKTDMYGRGEWLAINSLGSKWCPVATVREYMSSRNICDQFFVHAQGTPLTRFQFSAVFRSSLRAAGLNASEFGTHSFRIGAATMADAHGMKEEDVKRLGRWKSQAYKSYIRPDLVL
ncbi:treacle protein-like isoform X1 [Eleutherodactylus coqui]|uniref:treacle protein-like isoform X1 n=1 Tax=Eleutherodactylus coqui TaxID=57060 RepID=UPI003463156A